MADLFRPAAFRTQPFLIGTHVFPVLSAETWLGIMSSDRWIVDTVSSLAPVSYDSFLDGVESGETSREQVVSLARSALAQSAGRPWWEAERLVGACFNDSGRLIGTILNGGVDPSRMTLAVFLACVWAALTKGADAERLISLEASLLVPPPDATPEERAGLDDDDMYAMVDRMRAMPGVRTG